VQVSGYQLNELLAQPHNLVRHPDMPKAAFADMWYTLKQGEPWRGYGSTYIPSHALHVSSVPRWPSPNNGRRFYAGFSQCRST
ncbi:hypothetical protein MJI46_34815, partial [Salmonella enterica subsp. enterica serovar Cerro]|nr:hypothetical protein [Salmonella enterica subsp. enterica serovar Cerro]